MKTKTGLENEYGQNVSLKSVHLEGKLEGLLLTMLVKQRYPRDRVHWFIVDASSSFYAEFETLIRAKVDEWLDTKEESEDE